MNFLRYLTISGFHHQDIIFIDLPVPTAALATHSLVHLLIKLQPMLMVLALRSF
jgi:hypothetical protein